jgi:hypothetical protein
MNTEFKYRTFDDLLNSVQLDLKRFDLEGMIEPQSLIKVAMRINHLLGVKIGVAKEKMITVSKGKAKLPADFDVLNFAFVSSGSSACEPSKEYTYITPHCGEGETITNDCGEDIQVSPRIQLVYETYAAVQTPKGLVINTAGCCTHDLVQLRITKPVHVAADCYNVRCVSQLEGYIKDGFLIVNFDDGELYINYQSIMEDAEGNLLVLDHPRVNDFYEYSLKERIIENLLAESEDVARLYELYALKTRQARIEALSYIKMPDFNEMRKMWETNRKAMMNKYYSMFK